MNTTAFAELAAHAGLKPKVLYKVGEVARVLGVKTSTLYDEMAAGRMRYHLPDGRKQGKLIRPEWVDEWLEDGTHGRA